MGLDEGSKSRIPCLHKEDRQGSKLEERSSG